MTDDEWFDTPEEAALDGWWATPTANARVIEVLLDDADHARVIVDTEPSHPMEVFCGRSTDGRWRVTHDHSV